MKPWILPILSTLFTGLLWLMQMVPSESNNIIYKWIKEWAFWIGFGLVVAVIIIQICIYWRGRHAKKKWTSYFLRHIIKEHLGGNNYNTRITIFRSQIGIKVFIKQILFLMIVCFKQENKDKITWKRFAINPFKNYLISYSRYEYPKGQTSYTYFKISKQIGSGVASYTFSTGQSCKVKTESITPMLQNMDWNKISKTQMKRLLKYMKDTKIDKTNLYLLKLLNRCSNNIFSQPILNSDNTVWGVLIIDVDDNIPNQYETEIDTYLEQYMKIFQFSLPSIN